jgi:hypothetical protein
VVNGLFVRDNFRSLLSVTSLEKGTRGRLSSLGTEEKRYHLIPISVYPFWQENGSSLWDSKVY